MFSDFILEIVTSAAVAATLTGLLLWLTKSWVSERLKNAIRSEFDQKLETHKSQLKAQTETEVERLKSNLSIAAAERQIKFSKLHEKRAEVIAETYSLLKEVYVTTQDYVKIFEPAGDKPREARQEIAFKAHKALRQYYPKKIIYIPCLTAEKLETIDMELVKIFNEFAYTVDFQQGVGDARKWNDIFEKMRGEISEALKDLENEFRKLLGDES
ncbi:MAG: hypothetical protein KUG79_19810 [Pseudomonadales bacterium]|nr:hypothetical protein [Pseudomonadales bacterium]